MARNKNSNNLLTHLTLSDESLARVASGMSTQMDEHLRMLQGRYTYEERKAENLRLLNAR